MQKIQLSSEFYSLTQNCSIGTISEKMYYRNKVHNYIDNEGIITEKYISPLFPSPLPELKDNYFDMAKDADKAGQISFLPNNRENKVVADCYGEYDYFGCVNIRMSGKPAKVLRKILGDNLTSDEYEQFSAYVAKKYISLNRNSWAFDIVTGEAIRESYLEDNYIERPANSSGNNLYGSCMRDEDSQSYLDIYVNNPNHVALAIATCEEKIVARSLVWKKVSGISDSEGIKGIFDTIYSINFDATNWLQSHLESMGYGQASKYKRNYNMSVCLPEWDFSEYPYIDTFRYGNEGTLYADDCEQHSRTYNNTSGGYEDNCQQCYACGNNIYNEDTSERISGNVYCDNCYVYSERYGRSYRTSECVYSEYNSSYLPERYTEYINGDYYDNDQCVQDYNGDYITMDDAIKLEFGEYKGEWADISECTNVDNIGWVLDADISAAENKAAAKAAKAAIKAAKAAIKAAKAAKAASKAGKAIKRLMSK